MWIRPGLAKITNSANYIFLLIRLFTHRNTISIHNLTLLFRAQYDEKLAPFYTEKLNLFDHLCIYLYFVVDFIYFNIKILINLIIDYNKYLLLPLFYFIMCLFINQFVDVMQLFTDWLISCFLFIYLFIQPLISLFIH